MKNQRGFTLLEVTLAMALFSLMLFVVMVIYLAIMTLYESGTAARSTQQSARFDISEIVNDGRSANTAQVGGSATDSILCFLGASNPVQFYVDTTGRLHSAVLPSTMPGALTCSGTKADDPSLSPDVYDDHAISSSNVVVSRFTATPADQDASGNYHSVDLDIEYASQGASIIPLFGGNNQCDPTQPNLQYCSVTRIHTSVTLRGN